MTFDVVVFPPHVPHPSVIVMGIDNMQRTEKAIKKKPVYANLKTPMGVEKALLQEYNVPVRHVVEVYADEWNNWREPFRQWILANLLLEITPDADKKNRPDCVGFKVLLEVSGVDWTKGFGENLPNLLLQDNVVFNMDLRPGLPEEDGEDGEDD